MYNAVEIARLLIVTTWTLLLPFAFVFFASAGIMAFRRGVRPILTRTDRCGSIQDSSAFGHSFFAWYNDRHRHSGLELLTPAMVHFGSEPEVAAQRQLVLDAAFQAHPERFVRKPPDSDNSPHSKL